MKIRATDIPTIRTQIQMGQGNKCPLCKANFGDGKLVGRKVVPKYTPVLDHDHDSGAIRGVLCNNCNGMEGKIKNRVRRAQRDLTQIQWLENLLTYWKQHEKPKTPYTHPTHKSEDEKRLARNKKARLVRARRAAVESLKGLK